MPRRVTSLLLAFALFACPYFCGSGCCSGVEGASAASHSCCQAPGHGHAPADHAPGKRGHSDAGCQCICAGAVVDHASAPPIGVDTAVWAPVALGAAAVVTSASHSNYLDIVLQPDDGMNVGRALRCRHMSLVC